LSSACCTPSRKHRGDGGILVLAADLVDFVDVDDALLGAIHVAVGGLQQLEDDVFHILAHIAGLVRVVASTMAKGTSSILASV